jgi:hypothetical protein
MANKEYKKKIVEHIKNLATSGKKAKPSSTGLLSPKDTKPSALQQQKDSIAYVSEYIFTLRKQRKAIKANRGTGNE